MRDAINADIQHVKSELTSIDEQLQKEIGQLELKSHTHSNQSILDQTTASFTSNDKTKLDGLSNYDDSDIKNQLKILYDKSHTHSNQSILDQTTAVFTSDDKSTLDTLKNIDISSINSELTELLEKSHTHLNQVILDKTTASFTREYETKLHNIETYSIFKGSTPTQAGVKGLVPAPQAGEQDCYLKGDGTWSPVSGSGSLTPATRTNLGGVIIGDNINVTSAGVISVTFPETPYELPVATTTQLGGIKIGSNINVTNDGVISVTFPTDAETVNGHTVGIDVPSDALFTDTIYELPVSTSETLGGVKIGSGIHIDANGVISVTETPPYELPIASYDTLGGVKIGNNIDIANGVISVTFPTDADTVNGHTVLTDVPVDAVFTDTIYTLPQASTTELGGVIIGDNINVDENGVISVDSVIPYELPIATNSVLGGVMIGDGIDVDENGVISVSGGGSGSSYIAGAGISIDEIEIIDGMYERLAYIESDGTQYIDTGYCHNPDDWYGLNCMFVTGNNSAYEVAMGSNDYTNSTQANMLMLWSRYDNANKIDFSLNDTGTQSDVYYTGSDIYGIKINVFMFRKRLNIHDASDDHLIRSLIHGSKSLQSITGHPSITLMGRHWYDVANSEDHYDAFSKLRVYGFQIWSDYEHSQPEYGVTNEYLVASYIPARRISDNAVGLYDIVNKEFLTSPVGNDFTFERMSTESSTITNTGVLDISNYTDGIVSITKNGTVSQLDICSELFDTIAQLQSMIQSLQSRIETLENQ